MNLIINNKIIVEPIINIIQQLKKESNYQFFHDIQDKGSYIRVTCPFHKEGHESHPSCSIYVSTDNNNIVPGTLHCFTCGAKYQLFSVVSYCLNLNDDELGKEWLIQRFGQLYQQDTVQLEKIQFNSKKETKIDENILYTYEYNNPYALNYLLNVRHLSRDIIEKFKVGYDKNSNSVTFPTWSSNGDLVGVFKRNIETKKFVIPDNIVKPIYLLDYIIKNNITTVYVVESQINALTLYGWDRPAVALFGTGTQDQYKELNKSGIRHYILCFDPDDAGYKGQERFIKNISKDVFVDCIQLPKNKDVNNLTFEEFRKLEEIYL